MDNQTQNDQFQKGMYQTPATTHGESFHAPVVEDNAAVSDEEVNKRFDDIAREEIARAYNEITQDLEMSISGYETRQQPQVEVLSQHPIAVELLQIGNEVEKQRDQFLASLQADRNKGRLKKMANVLFSNTTPSTEPTFANIVDRESKLAAEIFPKDPDVSKIKFFFLRNEQGVPQWFHEQISSVPAKRFTNTYTVSEYSIVKSSTYYDPRSNSYVNTPAVVDETEARNLLYASKQYYEKVTGKVYVKSAAPRLRLKPKSDGNTAA